MNRFDSPKENHSGKNRAFRYGIALSCLVFSVFGLFSSSTARIAQAQSALDIIAAPTVSAYNFLFGEGAPSREDSIQAAYEKNIYELTGRSADGTVYSGENAASSVFARVYQQQYDPAKQNYATAYQLAKDASYAAFLKLDALTKDEATKAYDLNFQRKSTAEINADPKLKAQALEYEKARNALLAAKLDVFEKFKIINASSSQAIKDTINKPEGSIIANQDAVMARLKAQEAFAARMANEPIYCVRESSSSVMNGDGILASALPDFSFQGCIALGLYYGFLKPSSWVLWAAGVAFNYSIDFTLNFGKFIRDEGLGNAGNGPIYLGWSAIRDLINVGFIFILLYAGIATILGLDGYGVKQTIIKVVIAALLLNFSLFFTKAVIDVSNLIALQFYTRVLAAADIANSSDGALTRGDENGNDWDGGISIGIVNAMGLKTIWTNKDKTVADASQFGTINTPGQLIIVCLGGGTFILITAFTMFMATIRFLYRSIVLIFLMILSPVGFVGGAIPPLKGAASKWQGRLKDNLLFAPAYMAIFYVVALIVFGKGVGPDQTGINSGVGLSGFASLFQGNVSGTGTLFWFIMIIGLMLGTQLAADQFADSFKFADGFKKKAKAFAMDGFGVGGYVGRRAVGGLGNTLSQSKAVQTLLARSPLKHIGGQYLYNKIGDLKDVKVGGASLTEAKKAREARDEKTRDRFSEIKAPRRLLGREDEKEFKSRKDRQEEDKKAAHFDRLGIDYIRVPDAKDPSVKKVVARPKSAGGISKYNKDNVGDNKRFEKEAFDSAEFNAKRIGGISGASRLAAVKKARTGNKGSVKGIEDQLSDLAKEEKALLENPAFISTKNRWEAEVKKAETRFDAVKALADTDPSKIAAAEHWQDQMDELDEHMKKLNDVTRRMARLESDLARANSKSS